VTPTLLLDERYRAEPRCVMAARRAAAGVARAAGLGEEQTWDLMLAVSEAVTNAVVHGFVGREAPGHVRLRAALRGSELVVSVEDDGVGVKPRADSPGLGLGLPTIAAVASSLDVRRGDGGTGTHLCFSFMRESPTVAAAA
jgi:anti-sigma regulatory factor (Ser/Thr protein kinase)